MSTTRLFDLPGRGVIAVRGSERVRWLDGMLTNDIPALEAAGPGSGCPALLLTHQGRVVADPHVLRLDDELWLEVERSAIAPMIERLDKLIIADDVALEDISNTLARMALEGPEAAAWLGVEGVAQDHWVACEVAGVAIRAAAYAFTGGPGLQLFVPAASAEAVRAALLAAGAEPGDESLFERLRIEAGTPWLGRELDESVLPAEARLDSAISTTKGCYTGQEVVARLRSRDRRNHLLVGLRFAGDAPPAPGSKLVPGGAGDSAKAVGEVTSTVASPAFGAIGLAFVRSEHAEAGTELETQGAAATVAALPFADA